MREFLTRLRFFFMRKKRGELDEELQFHLEHAIEANIAVGMASDEARRQALIAFGGVERTREQAHEQHPRWLLGTVMQDIRYALRGFRRNPLFTITVIVTLALGIGTTAAIFSAIYSLLLRPLPYHDSNRLVSISMDWPKTHVHADVLISPDFVAVRHETKSFEQFAGYVCRGAANLAGPGLPVRVTTVNVTANLFRTLGVVPPLGRDFSQKEDRIGGPPVVLLSDHLWRNKFNANPAIVGKAVTLNGTRRTIIGVLPPHFIFPNAGSEPDIYEPADLDPNTSLAVGKGVWSMQVIARLRPGVNRQQAQAELQAFFLARAKSYPAEFASFSNGRQMVVESLQRYLTGDDRKPLYILLVCVAAVLLIACANVANLQLARAMTRQHEMALRRALGASRLRLIRQSLVESLLLSSLAAVVGLSVAFVVVWLIRHAGTLDGSQVPLHSRAAQLLRLPFGKLSVAIQIDGWVLAFTVGLALLTTLLFGLAPAVSGTRTDLRNALQAAVRHISSGQEQRLLRHSLLVIEIGLAIALLASAGLLVRSFVNVLRYDSGFNPSNMLVGTMTLMTGERGSSERCILDFVDELLPRLKALPGIDAAAITSAIPLERTPTNSAISFEGVPLPRSGNWPTVSVISVTPDYFRAVGTSLFRGRAFNVNDGTGTARVAIVNRAFANRYFAGNALGKRFNTNIGEQNVYKFTPVAIVGIVNDVRHGGLKQETQPEVYWPMAQLPNATIDIVLRTQNDPASLANAMRHVVASVDPEQPLFDIQTMNQRISDLLARRRLILLLIVCFAMLGVVLSAVGVYGVFSYSITQRAQEIGIRLALGASRSDILQLVLLQATRLIALGGILGVVTALALSKLLTSLLVGITSHDAVSFWLAWALMTVVALLASAIPAADAARTDLISVLRSE